MNHLAPPPKAPALPVPDLAIDAGIVRAHAYDDIYFSAEGGLAETRHVFLHGNYLPQRWIGRLRFTIGEVGFGTGLNFLTTWAAFEETVTEPDARLFYVSTERSPLTPEQLAQALIHFPELAPYASHMVARYPIRVPGWHRIAFDRVVLWLGYGEAADLFSQFHAQVDAWFLDGFAPAKNADAWSDGIFREIERLSAPDTTCATFTAAGNVRDRLRHAGFTVEKTQGFGKKRDMLHGHRTGQREPLSLVVPQVAVIGAGIAGSSAAHALAERGAQVSVFDAETPASGASGNPAGVLYPRIGKHYTKNVAESFLGFAHGLREITRLGGWREGWAKQTGMLKYPKSAHERTRLYGVQDDLGLDPSVAHWLTFDRASQATGLELSDGGLWFPQGCWLRPRDYTRQYADHGRVRLNEETRVDDVEHYGEGFLIKLPQAACAATHVIFANAAACLSYSMSEHLPLRMSTGQLSILPQSDVKTPLKSVFCHRGYAIPTGDDYVIGATYDHENFSLNLRPENHHMNLATLMQYAPGMVKGKPKLSRGRISYRVSTPDKVPVTGRLMDAHGQVVPGAYASLGHASRGLISAPYGAEKIAAQIYDEPRPLSWR